jgi:small subunit ribosomal protein S2
LKEVSVASALVRELVNAGIHFGHRVSRWNPKMAPYIFGKRNMIHIIDIRETVKGLLRAKKYLAQVVASGQDVLFVGTKRQAKQLVQDYASKCGMHSVSERWLGGTLTNFRTIRSRLSRLTELEEMESSGSIQEFSKKRVSSLLRERKKIARNLDGVRNMGRLPGVLFVIDPRKEHIAVKEARKLGIPTVCLLDTDADPDYADIPIPGNDDAIRSIEIVLRELADAVEEGKRGRVVQREAPREAPPAQEAVAAAAASPARRRARRIPEGAAGQQPQAQAPAEIAIPAAEPEVPAAAPLVEPGQPNP